MTDAASHALADLRTALDGVEQEFGTAEDDHHIERLTLTVAIVSEALRAVGCRTLLVGGGAIEFYAPDAYLTRDVDLVVEDPSGAPVRERLATTFDALGFTKLSGRHWERNDLLVEVPGHRIDDPFIEVTVGPYRLNVVRLEVVLVGRVVEFDQTGHTGHAAQAVLLLRAAPDALDRELLQTLVRKERSERAFATLEDLAKSDTLVTDAILRNLHERLRAGARKPPLS